jgi:hypothetical protein
VVLNGVKLVQAMKKRARVKVKTIFAVLFMLRGSTRVFLREEHTTE